MIATIATITDTIICVMIATIATITNIAIRYSLLATRYSLFAITTIAIRYRV